MSHDDFESVPGLPGPLPEGEVLLWQGTPQWTALARRAFRLPLVSAYLAAMVALRTVVFWQQGQAQSAIAQAALSSALLSLIAIAVLAGLAWLSANATVYSITTRRVAVRHGISVGLTLNLPFSAIEAADLKTFGDGTGQIALRLTKGTRVGYLLNWPHVRPGRYTRPEPLLRALENVQEVAAILGSALAASAGAANQSSVDATRAPAIAVRLPTSAAA